MKEDISAPIIVIDCLRNRIRIHRSALHLLGNPDYIVLMVNPTSLTFAILPSTKLQIAHAVRWDRLSDKHCFELYSKPLIQQLCNVCPGWSNSSQFPMAGTYIEGENLIRVSLTNAKGRSLRL